MNIPTRFNPTARWLHWSMAAMIVSMLFIGVGMVTSISARPWLIDLHRPLGIAILLLVVLRLRNRMRHRPPALPSTLPHWQKTAARASHWLLYGLMLAMPLIGWAMLSAGGYPVQMSPSFALPPILPQDVTLYAALRAAHGWLAYLLFATVLLHLSAALLHAWVYRDGVFQAMAGRIRQRVGRER
ncbi:cytochrome b/b6 domain-containing protein [Lysobacter sp. F60174L2]|uniref:cytochrome b/b6 domain-containing protein n=1 Tax=Lysobacter sp. F60174L2 TaxID=3459295 RepID=UPI00403DFBDA